MTIADTHATELPLDGVSVLDFSTLAPGPFATLLLAAAGARVTKVERPEGGDSLRARPASFALLNGGKQSVAIDLKSPADLERLRPLLRECDVVVEQFRPGVMDRLGLGYPAVAEINPRVIYCSITGYGQTGARRGRAGHDLNYVGHSGALGQGGPAGAVGDRLPPGLLADIGGGGYPAVVNILLALINRERTGLGCALDIAISDNLFPFVFPALGEAGTGPDVPGAGRLSGGSPRYQTYPALDGRLILVAALEQKFWDACCDAIGLSGPLRDDSANPAATMAAVAELIAGRPSSHWREVFEETDCCCTVAATISEALVDPAFRERGLFAGRSATGELRLPVPLSSAVSCGELGPPPVLGSVDLRSDSVHPNGMARGQQ